MHAYQNQTSMEKVETEMWEYKYTSSIKSTEDNWKSICLEEHESSKEKLWK